MCRRRGVRASNPANVSATITDKVTEPSDLSVVVRGSGVAAYCSARLLHRAGVHVTLQEAGRSGVPAIMIGDATQSLITDVFERQNLFDGLHRISQRVVAWGVGAEPITLPHSAIVVSEEQLCHRLRPQPSVLSNPPDCTIYASRPLAPGAVEQHFGSRTAQALAVRLKENTDASNCWIESVEQGWLFLIPNSPSEGWLLSVGHTPGTLLSNSRLIAPRLDSMQAASGPDFPAYPRIIDPICGPGWLACGTAAMAFDPICGDGTGNAVREAILACAVTRAGADSAMLDHYRKRLIAGFTRHLEQCRVFYSTAHNGDWWRGELDRIHTGLNWCQSQLGARQQFHYQLRGFDLQPVIV